MAQLNCQFIRWWCSQPPSVQLTLLLLLLWLNPKSTPSSSLLSLAKVNQSISYLLQGMVNDAVAIIIVVTVQNLADANKTSINFYWYTPFTLILQFIKEFALSLLIGYLVGKIIIPILCPYRLIHFLPLQKLEVPNTFLCSRNCCHPLHGIRQFHHLWTHRTEWGLECARYRSGSGPL